MENKKKIKHQYLRDLLNSEDYYEIEYALFLEYIDQQEKQEKLLNLYKEYYELEITLNNSLWLKKKDILESQIKELENKKTP